MVIDFEGWYSFLGDEEVILQRIYGDSLLFRMIFIEEIS